MLVSVDSGGRVERSCRQATTCLTVALSRIFEGHDNTWKAALVLYIMLALRLEQRAIQVSVRPGRESECGKWMDWEGQCADRYSYWKVLEHGLYVMAGSFFLRAFEFIIRQSSNHSTLYGVSVQYVPIFVFCCPAQPVAVSFVGLPSNTWHANTALLQCMQCINRLRASCWFDRVQPLWKSCNGSHSEMKVWRKVWEEVKIQNERKKGKYKIKNYIFKQKCVTVAVLDCITKSDLWNPLCISWGTESVIKQTVINKVTATAWMPRTVHAKR
jgi:hypothetical protein